MVYSLVRPSPKQRSTEVDELELASDSLTQRFESHVLFHSLVRPRPQAKASGRVERGEADLAWSGPCSQGECPPAQSPGPRP